jgi:hypothetical protein
MSVQSASAYNHDVDIPQEARDLATTIDVPGLSAYVTREIINEVWPDSDDADFLTAVDSSVAGNVHAIVEVIAGRMSLETARPQAALDLAELTAKLEVPVSELERAYRIGVAVLWGAWFELAQAHAERGPATLGDLISGPTLTMMSYIDHILASVTKRHDAISCEIHQTQRHLRRLTLMQVLDGTIAEPTTELANQLDYHVSGTHLALLLETPDEVRPDATIARLRATAEARDTLVLQNGVRSWCVWLGRAAPFGTIELSRLRRELLETGLTIAAGEPASGLDGLRASRRQALETARVQRALGPGHRCLWAAEVRLEALLLADEPRARDFVAAELGPLSASDTLARRLRETLLTWLATGSHVSAASLLGVHENTVRNRIRQAEELLGASLLQRRTELQVALRLERVLKLADEAPAQPLAA